MYKLTTLHQYTRLNNILKNDNVKTNVYVFDQA